VARHGEAGRQALGRGEGRPLGTASEAITDAGLLVAIQSGWLRPWAEAVPDRRAWAEMARQVILVTEVAARFAQIYSPRQSR
jgi:hypothetical protein